MAEGRFKGLFDMLKDSDEKTVGTRGADDINGKSLWILGRSPECDIVCQDPKVSREHCRIELLEGHFYISDMGSTNGTYLNGKHISRKERLFVGDVIGIGDSDIVFSKSILT